MNADLHMAGELKSTGKGNLFGIFGEPEKSFFVRHAYFLGAKDPYKALKITLKAEIDSDAGATLHSDISRPFDRPEFRPDRRQGHKPPRRRGDEGFPFVITPRSTEEPLSDPNPPVSGGYRAPLRPRWHRRRSAASSCAPAHGGSRSVGGRGSPTPQLPGFGAVSPAEIASAGETFG